MAEIASRVIMVRPRHFGFNPQTAEDNAFQHRAKHHSPDEVAEMALAEFDRMVDQLRQKGIEVNVLREPENDICPDAIFPNNWFSTFDEQFILYPMYTPNRRAERREPFIDRIELLTGMEANRQLLDKEPQGAVLEGTGSLVCDHYSKTAFIAHSERSDSDTISSFAALSGYRVIGFQADGPDREPIYHTNVLMCIGRSFALIGLDCVHQKDKARVVQSLEDIGKEVIALSSEQVLKNFAGNMLQLVSHEGEELLVMSSTAYSSLSDEQKDLLQNKHGQRLLHFEIPTIEYIGGGSVRCMIAELFT